MHVGHLLGGATEGLGQQVLVTVRDDALILKPRQPPLGAPDEVAAQVQPQLLESLVLARGGRLTEQAQHVPVA